jgi:hypothetical protein
MVAGFPLICVAITVKERGHFLLIVVSGGVYAIRKA